MHVTQTSAEGLKHEFKITVPAGQIEEKVEHRLKEVGQTVRLPGFRPGKVPLPLLRKKYKAAIMGEVLEAAVNDGTSQVLKEHNLRPAAQPKVEITAFAEGGDLEFTVALERLPEIELVEFSTIELEKPVAPIDDSEIDRTLDRIARSRESSEPLAEERGSQSGDIAVIDFEGKLEGVAFPGGKGEDYSLKLGSGSFIPGFEDQLIGKAAGEQTVVKVTFPEDYGNDQLAGKAAEFDVTVKELRTPVSASIDDALAKTMGVDNLEGLRNAIRDQIQRDHDQHARTHLKRQLLDKLAERYDFPVPQAMADQEFEAIWKQVEEDKAQGRLDAEDQGKDEDTLKADYRRIAERRVRLGLVLAEIGRQAAITVTQEDINRAVVDQARRFPGQEHLVFQFYQKNKEAVNQLRAPLFEDKVIDHVIAQTNVTEKAVTVEELTKDPDGGRAAA